MWRGCILLCENCKKKTPYFVGEENFCLLCKKRIVLEKGIEDLVVTLNFLGVSTLSSSVGYDNFDEGKRNYPWVAISGDSKEWAEELIKNYNRFVKKKRRKWKIDLQQTTLGDWMYFIVPLSKERRVDDLQREVRSLAKYLAMEC